jgi:hypothetical protein
VQVDRSRAIPALRIEIANRGNVNERLLRGHVTLALRRAERRVALLVGAARDLLPRTRGSVVIPCPRLRGRFTAVVTVTPTRAAQSGPGLKQQRLRPIVRSLPIRL